MGPAKIRQRRAEVLLVASMALIRRVLRRAVAPRRDRSWLPFSSGAVVASEFGSFCLPFSPSVGSAPPANAPRTVGSAVAALASQGVLLPPGVGVDVDNVTVLREAIDKRDHAGSAGEHGAPLLERQVGCDRPRMMCLLW